LEMKKENMTSNMGDDSINSGNISTQQYAPVAILEEDKEEEKKKKKKKESNNALSENDLEFTPRRRKVKRATHGRFYDVVFFERNNRSVGRYRRRRR